MVVRKALTFARRDPIYVAGMLIVMTVVGGVFGSSDNVVKRAAIGLLIGMGVLLVAVARAEFRSSRRNRRK